jgi:gamma-glutamylcyclotransferase (GGCT)/AIG2-like uncharacterized protein YtfP
VTPAKKLLFVYGTLKRGCGNHDRLAGLTFIGEARTRPGFVLYSLGDYPGLVAEPADRDGVTGEVWSVDVASLARLDAFEGVAEGLYRREHIPLLPPFADLPVETYFYARNSGGHRLIGSDWRE